MKQSYPKLTILTSSVHYEPLKAISINDVSALWNFYCSPTNCFVMWLSGYDYLQTFLMDNHQNNNLISSKK